ncbi:alpha-keto acid decarboxylase family protein [Bradyrhizobium elkanii]|uniref:alpha-keto acid decarboxylase family protein n=1 Tax=Bradyrhizobium elkanii TaxID=29448 RepID=UPI001BA5CA56|nr:thiamine pyrophosphate-binding protein [Bradyrhizobium elkanii]MBR1159674.1 alpha-keto acid decarboxylase family protein [Bradyrhizobium elkanii]
MSVTVVQHVLSRLRDIGITEVFGVPGDFSLPLNDTVESDSGMRWIGCANELNAAYAADGYARVRGVGAVCTTFGVGELSALNGIAGAYAEQLPVFHLVGTPPMSAQASRSLSHHTLGNGDFNLFHRISDAVACASAVMTPQNVAYETERLIREAFHQLRPVYMAFPADLALQPAVGRARPIDPAGSDPVLLAQVVETILSALDHARTACILPGFLVARARLQRVMQAVIDASGLPFATMLLDKSVLDESQSTYAGMYAGRLMNENVRQLVESCDAVLAVGVLFSDLNTGAFTSRIDPSRLISIGLHQVTVYGKTYCGIEMADVLTLLSKRLTRRQQVLAVQAASVGPASDSGADPITAAALYPRWSRFIRPGDIVVAETSTASMGLGFARLPSGANFYNQALWGSIGWATPAALGAALAAPDRRLLLITGEGSHQVTAQEIGQLGRLGLKPVIFVLNNGGYTIERLLCSDPDASYNDVAPWRYAELPRVFGCKGWMGARVTTCGELDQALERAKRSESGVYIEVVTAPDEAPPFALRLRDTAASLYRAE